MTNTNNTANTSNLVGEDLTFGIEIETKGLTNEQAARALAVALGGTVTRGTDYYRSFFVVMADGRKWRCMNDASLHGVSSEIVSPILRGANDVAMVQVVVRTLRRAGARVDEQCGIHVHVGAQGLDAKAIGNLAALVYSREGIIKRALGVLSARERWCAGITEAKAKALKGAKSLDAAGAAWYGSVDAMTYGRTEHYNATRYAGLNLHNVWFRGTVEFRWFNATLHAGKVRAYIALCLGLVNYAREAKSIPAKIATVSYGDERWTMYRLLYHRLGLKGDYYKNVREHLCANLPGSVRGGRITSDRLGGTSRPAARAAA